MIGRGMRRPGPRRHRRFYDAIQGGKPRSGLLLHLIDATLEPSASKQRPAVPADAAQRRHIPLSVHRPRAGTLKSAKPPRSIGAHRIAPLRAALGQLGRHVSRQLRECRPPALRPHPQGRSLAGRHAGQVGQVGRLQQDVRGPSSIASPPAEALSVRRWRWVTRC
jgi:hypothetical protein